MRAAETNPTARWHDALSHALPKEGDFMIDLMFPQWPSVYDYWSRAVTGLVRNQWELLDAHYAVGLELLDAVSDSAVAPEPKLQTLEQDALERTEKGMPPPREVYDVQNRSRIDWSRFPQWAKPTDPEAFEGTAHEG